MNTELPHILLIDDQPVELSQIVILLQSHNFRVSQTSDPQSGYNRARAQQPKLIVLDLYMPGMDGFSVCRLLKEDPATREIPVIFLSSSISVEERIEGLELGGVDFVTKPCSPEELLARIRVHLQLHRNRSAPSPAPAQRPESADGVILNAATRLIQAELENVPALEDIARAVGTYEKKLLQIFRRELGLTVFAYVREARMDKARTLLRDHPEMSIEEVANLVGFQSSANFSTAFRKKEGLSPRRYRRIYSGEHPHRD